MGDKSLVCGNDLQKSGDVLAATYKIDPHLPSKLTTIMPATKYIVLSTTTAALFFTYSKVFTSSLRHQRLVRRLIHGQ